MIDTHMSQLPTGGKISQENYIESRESPWPCLYIDFVGPIKGQYYFKLVDGYSKCPENFQMNRLTSDKTLIMFKKNKKKKKPSVGLELHRSWFIIM